MIYFYNKNFIFDYNKIMNSSMAIHCDTKNKAEQLFRFCKENNLKWKNESNNCCNWETYKEKTCYILNLKNHIYYGYINCVEADFHVLKFEDVIVLKKNKIKINNILQRKSTGIYINSKKEYEELMLFLSKKDFKFNDEKNLYSKKFKGSEYYRINKNNIEVIKKNNFLKLKNQLKFKDIILKKRVKSLSF